MASIVRVDFTARVCGVIYPASVFIADRHSGIAEDLRVALFLLLWDSRLRNLVLEIWENIFP